MSLELEISASVTEEVILYHYVIKPFTLLASQLLNLHTNTAFLVLTLAA